MTTLMCSQCGETKPETEFHRTSKYKKRIGKRSIRKANARDYRFSECKGCQYKRDRRWLKAEPDRQRTLYLNRMVRDSKLGRGTYERSIVRAKKRGVRVALTLEEWQEVYHGTHCHWCGLELHRSFTNIDHIVPLSEGGEHTRSNLVAACANCNMRRAWERKTKYGREK